MRINIVIDNPDSWFNTYKDRLVKNIRSMGHACVCYSSRKQVPSKSDITFFLSCEEYVGKKVRDKSRYNIVVHASDLPKGKGMSPSTWQILDGKHTIPNTLFEIAEGFDTGDYYLKENFKLDGTELKDEWQEKLYKSTENLILTFLKRIKSIKPIKQQGRSTIYKRRRPDDSEVDINKSIKDQFNLFRVVDNEQYPAYFKHKGKTYIIKIYKK